MGGSNKNCEDVFHDKGKEYLVLCTNVSLAHVSCGRQSHVCL